MRYSWGVRDIYVRHRNDCRYASPNPKKPTRLPARLNFGCGCPIYARLQVRHPDPGIAPFEFNGSLSKLGVREKLAAEERDLLRADMLRDRLKNVSRPTPP